MSDGIRPYTADWIVSFRCELKSDQQPVWIPIAEHKDDWTAKRIERLDSEPDPKNIPKKNAEPNSERDDGRVELSKRINSERFKEFVGDLKDTDGTQLVDDLEKAFSWIPPVGRMQTAKAFDDRPVCTLLNHVVAAQSTRRLTIVTSVVGSHRVTEIRGLRLGQPSWHYTSESDTPVWRKLIANYVLSCPELFASWDGGKVTMRPYDEIEENLTAHRQKYEVSILKYEKTKETCILRLQMQSELCRYKRGALCNCIPIPGKPIVQKARDPKEPVGVYSPEIVISSPVVQSALHSLSDIWQDKAYAILISSPPGSGKENLALSIPYGSGLKKHDDEERIPTISLANGLPAQQEKQILGYQQDDGSIVDGMLAKASGAAIFIDEAHYPLRESGVRASLLRPLETKEYYPVNSLELRQVDDVQWIFASSLSLNGKDSLSNVPPDDFWTRMTHQIRIEHPLDRDEFLPDGANWPTRMWQRREATKQQKKTVADLFKFFWWDRTKSHFGINPVKVLMDKKKTESDDLRTKDVAEQLFRGYIETLLKQVPLDKIAELFATALMKEARSKSLTNVSIRGLRSMVSRIFSKCVGFVTSGSLENYGLLFKLEKGETMDAAAQKFVLDDIRNVIRESQQIARLKS